MILVGTRAEEINSRRSVRAMCIILKPLRALAVVTYIADGLRLPAK
jgi:hypothetical protein